METKKTDHSVYNLNYHLVFCTKYRNKVLTGAIEIFVKERTEEICKYYGWELLVQEVMPDHMHIFVSAPPKIAPLIIARTLKSIIANDVFNKFPRLKQNRFWGSGFFNKSTYYGSAGSASSDVIQKYIEDQKNT